MSQTGSQGAKCATQPTARASRLFRLSSYQAPCDGARDADIVDIMVGEDVHELWHEGPRLRLEAASARGTRQGPYVIEPLRRERRAALLVLSRGERTFRVNGGPPAHAAALGAGDVVTLDGGAAAFEVAVAVQSQPGQPPERAVGRMCPICQGPIVPGTRVYLCPACDTPIHLELEEAGGTEALRCLELVSECPVCREPVPPVPPVPQGGSSHG